MMDWISILDWSMMIPLLGVSFGSSGSQNSSSGSSTDSSNTGFPEPYKSQLSAQTEPALEAAINLGTGLVQNPTYAPPQLSSSWGGQTGLFGQQQYGLTNAYGQALRGLGINMPASAVDSGAQSVAGAISPNYTGLSGLQSTFPATSAHTVQEANINNLLQAIHQSIAAVGGSQTGSSTGASSYSNYNIGGGILSGQGGNIASGFQNAGQTPQSMGQAIPGYGSIGYNFGQGMANLFGGDK